MSSKKIKNENGSITELVLLADEVEKKRYEKITKNGEITYDHLYGEYIVWDETYTEVICKTPYKPIAEAALAWYCENVLGA